MTHLNIGGGRQENSLQLSREMLKSCYKARSGTQAFSTRSFSLWISSRMRAASSNSSNSACRNMRFSSSSMALPRVTGVTSAYAAAASATRAARRSRLRVSS